MSQTLAQEPILITGVGKRLGLALAEHFLEQSIPVIGTYRTKRDDIKLLEDKGAELYYCDFYDVGSLSQLIASIKTTHFSLRAIIHNASDWMPEKSELPPSEIMAKMMQVHASAPYQINLELAPLLQATVAEHADIIHIGDYVSQRGSKKHIAYAASKAAQDNLTLSFAASLSPAIKVNSIAPAMMLFNDDDEQPYREKTLNKSLMQREGGKAEFIRAVDYLLDSHFITGRIIHLDGGRHLK